MDKVYSLTSCDPCKYGPPSRIPFRPTPPDITAICYLPSVDVMRNCESTMRRTNLSEHSIYSCFGLVSGLSILSPVTLSGIPSFLSTRYFLFLFNQVFSLALPRMVLFHTAKTNVPTVVHVARRHIISKEAYIAICQKNYAQILDHLANVARRHCPFRVSATRSWVNIVW